MADHFNSALIPKRAGPYFEANRSVLVIEDDRIMGEMIMDTLDDVGFEVRTAANGQMAFEQLQQRPVNFILLDLSLPGMDGFEIYSRLQQNPVTKNIPVIIATAWDDDARLEKATQIGLRHFLPKPFSEDELLSSILTLLLDISDKTEILPQPRIQARSLHDLRIEN